MRLLPPLGPTLDLLEVFPVATRAHWRVSAVLPSNQRCLGGENETQPRITIASSAAAPFSAHNTINIYAALAPFCDGMSGPAIFPGLGSHRVRQVLLRTVRLKQGRSVRCPAQNQHTTHPVYLQTHKQNSRCYCNIFGCLLHICIWRLGESRTCSDQTPLPLGATLTFKENSMQNGVQNLHFSRGHGVWPLGPLAPPLCLMPPSYLRLMKEHRSSQ